MNEREIFALGAYVRAKGVLGYVKGGGWSTTKRLAARGFVEVAQEQGDRFPFYTVTPDGEAEWRRRTAIAEEK